MRPEIRAQCYSNTANSVGINIHLGNVGYIPENNHTVLDLDFITAFFIFCSQQIYKFINVFLNFCSEQLTCNRYKAVEKLLQMLQLIVQQPGSLGANLLPSIIDFTLNYVSPLLMQERQPNDFCDVAFALYSLFDGYVIT